MSQRPLLLQSPHKNLQRLASLALCVSCASTVRPSTAVRLGQGYRDFVARRVPVSADAADRVTAYIAERALIRKYDGRSLNDIRAAIDGGRLRIEIQDWWLSDVSLRSRTGGEKEQSVVKTVTLCQELGLLAPQTLTVTSFGRLLLDVAEDSDLLPGARSNTRNPFSTPPPYAIAAFYRVATSDIPLQLALADVLGSDTTSFQTVSLEAEGMLKATLGAVPSAPTSRALRAWLLKELDNARRLAARVGSDGWSDAKGAAVQTLYRPFEDMLLPRLEFLVDVGLLEKPEPARYSYSPTLHMKSWREVLQGGLRAVEAMYFGSMGRYHGRRPNRLTEPRDVLAHLTEGYVKYRGRTGYAPILESITYANMRSWSNDPWTYVEVQDAFDSLRSLSTGEQAKVRLLSDRYRKPEAFSVIAP